MGYEKPARGASAAALKEYIAKQSTSDLFLGTSSDSEEKDLNVLDLTFFVGLTERNGF